MKIKIKEVAIYNENCALAGQVAHDETMALVDEGEDAREERGDVTYIDEETSLLWANTDPINGHARWMRRAGRNAAKYFGHSLPAGY